MQIKLDFSSLPSFERTSYFCCLELETEQELRPFSNVLERAQAAMRFCQHIGSGIAGDKEIMGAACLRASLMELVGIEEVLPLDLRIRGRSEERLLIVDTSSVLLIMLKELRNLNLHLANVQLRDEKRQAVSYRSIIAPQHHTFEAQLIPSSELNGIRDLRNSKHFDPDELEAAIQWFDGAQRSWGIADVVQAGIETYCRLIIKRYQS